MTRGEKAAAPPTRARRAKTLENMIESDDVSERGKREIRELLA